MGKAKEAIRVSGLTKIYNGKKVLDGLNLSVKNQAGRTRDSACIGT